MFNVQRIALGLAAGFVVAWLVLGAIRTPTMAAEDPALKDRFQSLEDKVKAIQIRLDDVQKDIKKLKGEGGESGKQTGSKVAQLEKQVQSLLTHTHEYLQEGRAADGSVQAVRPEDFMGRGLTSTGTARIGKPILGR